MNVEMQQFMLGLCWVMIPVFGIILTVAYAHEKRSLMAVSALIAYLLSIVLFSAGFYNDASFWGEYPREIPLAVLYGAGVATGFFILIGGICYGATRMVNNERK
ncbi:hypothetical protein [Serratia sp. OS31]|uniref:hypothetical protein n=1 Tax=Serratia sp. OS31 TaxID=2760844 RepID=UPI0016018FFC|nr:hypothetical protein [Serratia sp. OS31]MBB1585190.1 hypothetical protein [Serratia sp. OS31]